MVAKLGVQIRSTSVDLKHKFVLVPLVYKKVTCERDFMEMEMARASPSPSSSTTITSSCLM